MTETPATETPAVETPAAAPPAVETSAARPGRRRRVAALVTGVVVLGVLAGAGVWARSALAEADRETPTRYWEAAGKSAPLRKTPDAVPANELSGKLLPVPPGYVLGPDLDADGNNFFIAGEKAVEGFKESRKGLSSSDRKKRDEMFAELKLKGLAGRTYADRDGAKMVAEVRIMQADPKAVGKFSEVSKKVLDQLKDGREAPKVEGFPDAKCGLFTVGEKKEAKIESVFCVAVEGDVMVTFRAYGPKPLSQPTAVQFFRNQMSHLKSPGESA
ncbi:hypothetical protein A6A28_20060 [Streptomyces sp. CB03578]|uniref:hypothetical protein n=1 Tax=Streptomyces sp. CB03578 TaxID=1718987 RepID=UPI00093C48B8|nr:hypothetical protein [Streptomyces sp. CB03578]OKI25465.1 hypothetical protein A6A28_20060 [Streptomyces sp. CB03578]